jgi:hypothetical protein
LFVIPQRSGGICGCHCLLTESIDKFLYKFILLAEALPCIIRIVPEPPIPKIPVLQSTSITSKIGRAEETSCNRFPYRIT